MQMFARKDHANGDEFKGERREADYHTRRTQYQ